MQVLCSPPLLVLALWAALSRQAAFSNPNYVQPYGSGRYENVDVWYVGQSQEVTYDITDISGLNEYTIALWQQDLSRSSANIGPVVNSECSAYLTYSVLLYKAFLVGMGGRY